MFSNAKHTQINGGHFTVVNGASGSTEMDRLREHSCLSALLNSNERYDPPRCDEDTRVAIIRDIMAWINSTDRSASMTVLHGSAGAGKSALEQSIAERCLKEGSLAASFFFSRIALNRSDGNTLAPTIAYQIAQLSTAFRQKVIDEVTRNPGIFQLAREAVMEKLIVNCLQPRKLSRLRRILKRLSFRPPEVQLFQRLIVIDGLDECDDQDVQCDILRILAAIIPRLRLPIRILLACRPESHLMHTLNHHPTLQAIPVRRIDLGDDPNADSDIQVFLRKQFSTIADTHPLRARLPPSWPGEAVIRELTAKASTQFIYVSAVTNFIQSRKHKPDVRLQIVLGLTPSPTASERPFAQLDALYRYIFSCVEDIDTVLRIFGVIYLATKAAGQFGLSPDMTTPGFLEDIFGVETGEIELALDELLSLINIVDRGQPIKILHRSLFDFLLDRDRSGSFTLDIAFAHETLAIWRRECFGSEWNDWKTNRDHVVCFLKHCVHCHLSDQFITTHLDSLHLLDNQGQSFWGRVESFRYYSTMLRSFYRVFDREEILNHQFSLNFVYQICTEIRGFLFDPPHVFCKDLTESLRVHFVPFLERIGRLGSEDKIEKIEKSMIHEAIDRGEFLLFLRSVAYIPFGCEKADHGKIFATVLSTDWNETMQEAEAFSTVMGMPSKALLFATTLLPLVVYNCGLDHLFIRSLYPRNIVDGQCKIEQDFCHEVVSFLKRNKSEFDRNSWARLKDRWKFE